MRWIKKLAPWIGIGLCIALMARKAWVYGDEWEFSPRGIPVSALSPDGTTYRSGRSIDDLSMFLIKRGIEEAVGAALLALLFASAALLAAHLARYKRTLESTERRKGREAVLEYSRQLDRVGRRDEGQAVYDHYLHLLDAEMAHLARDPLMKGHFDEAMRRIDGSV